MKNKSDQIKKKLKEKLRKVQFRENLRWERKKYIR